MDSPVAESRVSTRQSFDLLGQGRLLSRGCSAVSQGRPRPSHHAADPSLRRAVSLAQVTGRGALLVGGHHFFLAMSWSICLSSISSATRRLRRSTSPSSSRHRRSAVACAGGCRCPPRGEVVSAPVLFPEAVAGV